MIQRSRYSERDGEVKAGHAERCPVCLGIGLLDGVVCHGCQRKGWVIIYDLPGIKHEGCQENAHLYSDEASPLFAKGPPPPILVPGCAPGCHTGKHAHHGSVAYIYGDPYNKKCARCGHPAATEYASGSKKTTPLCDCCWEDWGEIYKTVSIESFCTNGSVNFAE